MTAPTPHDVDNSAILKRESAMRVRNALLELLRAWEEHESLPRSIPTRAERAGEIKPERGHHNR